jgi:hypothetical protein
LSTRLTINELKWPAMRRRSVLSRLGGIGTPTIELSDRECMAAVLELSFIRM